MLDIYATKRPNAPIMVFIHGGAWRSGLAKDFADSAEMFVNAGAHFVVPDFINVIEAGGSLMPMAEQVRRAVAWVHSNAASFGGDPNRIHVAGRSSGAHLAGVTSDHRLESTRGAGRRRQGRAAFLRHVRPQAGAAVEALELRQVHRRDGARALAPSAISQRINCPVIVAHGTYETPEFQRQARDFAAALKAAGKPVQLLVGVGYNHFELPETLGNPYGLLGRAALDQMRLTPV